MAKAGNKKKGMFSKIETREDALEMTSGAAKGFLFVAVLQGVLGAVIAPSALIDAVLLAVLGLILLKSRSRTAAVLLLLVALGEGAVTVLNRLGVMKGGNNIILAVIMVIVAVRAVEATFKLHGQFSKPPRPIPNRAAA